MSSTSRTIMSGLGQTASLANSWVETLIPISIYATLFVNRVAYIAKRDVHDPLVIEWVACYAIVRGFLLSIEGAGIAFGNEKNKKIGLLELAGGLTSALLGILYECSYLTGVVPIAFALALNSIVKGAGLYNRGETWLSQHPDVEPKKALHMPDSPMGFNELHCGTGSNLGELVSAVSLVAIDYPGDFATSWFAGGFFAKGIFSAVAAVEKTNNSIQKITARSS